MSRNATNTAVRIAVLSLGVGATVLALKSFAALATGSIALFSDALESVVNVATAVATLVAVRLAARPANASLPYGYHKAEYFSAVLIGIFIAVAALLIFQQAWNGFVAPKPFDAEPIGIAVSILATGLNAGWAWWLVRQGRKERSPALVADGRHLWTDVVSTAGVLVGVMLAAATGWGQLDAILAALVGVTILWSGWELIKQSVIGLMDVAVEPAELNRIREIIAANAEGALEAHDVRTRRAGKMSYVEFHLVVPGTMSVEVAHTICDQIEAALRAAIADTQVTIHVEPEAKAKHSGIVVL
jgi:cation diffusion facilitator family transporter